MSKRTRSTLCLASLGVGLILCASCAPIVAPVPATLAPANPIQNVQWEWTSVTAQSSGEVTTVPNPQDYTLVLHTDGTLSGKADCNSFTGAYAQENGFLISLGATTLAACGEASLGQQYVQLLSQVVAGGSDGAGGLALETAGGEQRMAFHDGGAATP